MSCWGYPTLPPPCIWDLVNGHLARRWLEEIHTVRRIRAMPTSSLMEPPLLHRLGDYAVISPAHLGHFGCALRCQNLRFFLKRFLAHWEEGHCSSGIPTLPRPQILGRTECPLVTDSRAHAVCDSVTCILHTAFASVRQANSRVYRKHARAFMRTLAKHGEVWRTLANPQRHIQDKLRDIHQSSGEGRPVSPEFR